MDTRDALRSEATTSGAGRRKPVAEWALLDRSSTLLRALGRKVRRKFFGLPREIEPAFRFGYVIFDRLDLDGGGAGFGLDYIRILRELGVNECGRLFEFCAGPGYIGYSLLARGFCKSLTLADVNPVAVAAAKETAAFNGLAHSVAVYRSDCLDQMPPSEKWDLVVGNPPHFLDWKGILRCEDTDWKIHKRFYSQVKRFLNPGAQVLLLENALGSRPEDFIPMIRDGGGEYVGAFPGPDLGAGNKLYYLLSRWNS